MQIFCDFKHALERWDGEYWGDLNQLITVQNSNGVHITGP